MTFDGYRDAVLVGEGGLGRVFRAVRISTGGEVAIKELREVEEGSPAWYRARRELEALLRLKGHPYVVSVEEIIAGPSSPALVMEYLSGGSLADRVSSGALPTAEIVFIGQCVAHALSAAHEVGIVHRDIKPHNVLIGGFGQVKVCDFGIAALVRGEGSRTQTKAMTLAYASPEELDGDEHVGPPADVYSLSATLLHLITGRQPSFRDRLANQWPIPERSEPVVDGIIHLVRRGLSSAPENRPTMADYCGALDALDLKLGAERLSRISVAKADPLRRLADTVGSSSPPVATAVKPLRSSDDDTVLRSDSDSTWPTDHDPHSADRSPSLPPNEPLHGTEIVYGVSRWKRNDRRVLAEVLEALSIEFSWERHDIVVDKRHERTVDCLVRAIDVTEEVRPAEKPHSPEHDANSMVGFDVRSFELPGLLIYILEQLAIPLEWDGSQVFVYDTYSAVVESLLSGLKHPR